MVPGLPYSEVQGYACCCGFIVVVNDVDGHDIKDKQDYASAAQDQAHRGSIVDLSIQLSCSNTDLVPKEWDGGTSVKIYSFKS